MKKVGVIAASVAAATSSVALASLPPEKNEDSRKDGGSESRRGDEKGKFAPRFDGLRFIETLVTAHR